MKKKVCIYLAIVIIFSIPAFVGASTECKQKNPESTSLALEAKLQCPDVNLQGWQEYRQSLKNLNQEIFSSIMAIQGQKQQIEEMAKKLINTMKEVQEKVDNKDISSDQITILNFMEKTKQEIELLKEKISENKRALVAAYKTIADKYCLNQKYITFFEKKAREAKERNEESAYAYYADIISMLKDKHQIIKDVMKSLEDYYKKTEELYGLMSKKIDLLSSLQYHIVTFVDEVCKPKMAKGEACIYHLKSDLRYDEVALIKAVRACEASFRRLVKLVKEHFEEST